MDQITLRVIDGPDTGNTFSNLDFPVSIGREKDNSIALKDERVSRFHLKIVKESDQPLLVDLGSTNGTQVNGEGVQFWFLRPGDLILMGRSSLLFGSRAEIAERLKKIRNRQEAGDHCYPPASEIKPINSEESLRWERTYYSALQKELFSNSDSEALRLSFPPKIPSHLSPGQIAEMTSFLSYYLIRFRDLIDRVRSFDTGIDSSFKGQASASKDDILSEKKNSFLKKIFSREPTEKGPDKNNFLSDIIPDGGIFLSLREYENLLDMVSLFSDYLSSLTRDNDSQDSGKSNVNSSDNQ